MLKNVISVIDGETGSCGKAKVIGEIATDPEVKLGASVTNCMPNAGHTFVDEDGKSTVFRNIPVSSVNPDTELFIGPGSAIDMETFADEYERVSPYVGDRKIYVHEMVPLIEKRHKDHEKATIKSGSTFKGCGAVTQEKVIRDRKLKFFKTFKNAVVCSNKEWLDRLYKHLDYPFEYVLMEGAQGCDLDLNHSGNYPYVTSRNISTTQLLADCGISAERLLQTIMSIRPFPIRINDVTKTGEVIYSGGYGTASALFWIEVIVSSLYGKYPHMRILDTFDRIEPSLKAIRKLVAHCPEKYLKQLFGEDYKDRRLDSLLFREVMELERLVQKGKGNRQYETKFLNLPKSRFGFPENTIIDFSEETSVTLEERKIFDLDIDKLINNCRINTPSSIYLNFVWHLDYSLRGKKGSFDEHYFSHHMREYFDFLEYETKTPICALGTGAKNGERILKMNPVLPINRGEELVKTESK